MTGPDPGSCFTLVPRGPFSLTASTRFLEGFQPAAYEGGEPGHLDVAFAAEGSWRTVGVCVRQEGDTVVGEVVGDAGPMAVGDQVARILSLDVDGSAFRAVAERDPVVAGLQRRHPGLRPVTFWSPYEAAAWALIGNRIRIAQAAAIKSRMAEELGEPVTVHGRRMHAFPPPARLARLGSFPGLVGPKPDRLRALAGAAAAGRLGALKELPGIGDFSAELVLLRGAGDPDGLPLHERRLSRAVAHAYGLRDEPSPSRLEEMAEAWRPYRTWVTVLLRSELEHELARSAGRPAKGR